MTPDLGVRATFMLPPLMVPVDASDRFLEHQFTAPVIN